MSTYKPTTSLDSEGEKGMRPSSGISSSSGLTSSSDAQQQANDGYRAVDERKRNKETASAAIESEADFFEAFGFIIEVTPDDAGRVVFGDNRITIELTPKEVEEADAAEEAATPTHPFQMSNATAAGVLKVRFKPGYVNSQLPTGWDAVTGFTSASISSSTYFWLKCVGTFVSAGADTYAVTIEATTTNARPSGTAITTSGFTSFRLLGVVTISGGAITSISNNVTANQQVESFGTINLWTP